MQLYLMFLKVVNWEIVPIALCNLRTTAYKFTWYKCVYVPISESALQNTSSAVVFRFHIILLRHDSHNAEQSYIMT